MTIRDSVTLAYTKFKTRKARSVLTIIGSAFLTSILMFITIAGTGLKNSVVNKANSQLAGMNLVSEYYYQDAVMSSSNSENQNLPESTVEDYKSQIAKKGTNPKNAYFTVCLTPCGSEVIQAKLSQLSSSNGMSFFGPQLETSSDDLLKPFIGKDQNLNWKSGDPLPIIVNMHLLQEAHADELSGLNDSKSRVAKLNELREKYLGKEQELVLTLNTAEQPQNKSVVEYSADNTSEVRLKARVVGFTPSSTSFFSAIVSGGALQADMNLPYSVAKQIPQFSAVSNAQPSMVFASFNSKEERNKYIESVKDDTLYSAVQKVGDLSESVGDFVKNIKNIFKWVIIVMIIFVTLPTMGTLGKILADSRRETGVFRAIGAKNRDIAQIYVVYSVIMSTVAFILSALIGSFVSILLTISKGGLLGASLTEFSGGAENIKVVLFGIDPLHWAFLYLILVVSAALGTVLPILRALRKDPISAMRDE